MGMPLGWEEIKTPEDLLLIGEKKAIRKIDSETNFRCRYLRNIGTFHYCGVLAGDSKLELNLLNPVINAKQSTAELCLYCMDEEGHKKCVNYRNAG